MKKILFFLFGFMATANINAQGYGYRFWTDGLSWTDFVPRQGDSSGASSELYCFFLQEPVCDTIDGVKVSRYALLCGMDEAKSWYDPEVVEYNNLRYNQVLFNLGEMTCRELQPLSINEERANELVEVAKDMWERKVLKFIRESSGGIDKAVVDRWMDSTSNILKNTSATGPVPELQRPFGVGFTIGFSGTDYINGKDGYLDFDFGADISLFIAWGRHQLGIMGRGGRVYSNKLISMLTSGATEELTEEYTFTLSHFGGRYGYAFYDKGSVRLIPYIGAGSAKVLSNETYRNFRYIDKGFYGELGISMDLKFSQSINLWEAKPRAMEYDARIALAGNYMKFGDNHSFGINFVFSIGCLARFGR